jgi:DNA-binding MarR family transcriptional regulator
MIPGVSTESTRSGAVVGHPARPAGYGEAVSAVIGAGHDLARLFDHLSRRTASLTGSQYGLLSVLRERDPQPCEPWEIGRALGSGSAQVTALLDGLERAGLVERRTHGEDRRRRWVHLTDAGRERVDRLSECVRALEEHLLAGHLTDAEAAALAALANRLRAAVSDMTASDLSFLLVADPGRDPERSPG